MASRDPCQAEGSANCLLSPAAQFLLGEGLIIIKAINISAGRKQNGKRLCGLGLLVGSGVSQQIHAFRKQS